MHSVMKQSSGPVTTKRQLSGLDARAYNAGMDSVLAAKLGAAQASGSRYAQQAGNRRISAERGAGLSAGSRSKGASRRLFSPADNEVGGYRQKHGKAPVSAFGI